MQVKESLDLSNLALQQNADGTEVFAGLRFFQMKLVQTKSDGLDTTTLTSKSNTCCAGNVRCCMGREYTWAECASL